MRRPARSRQRGSGGGAAPPTALSTDAWYTLIYVSPAEHRRLAARRRRVWVGALMRRGVSRSVALTLLQRREAWVLRREAAGTTPAIPEQLRVLGRWAGVAPRFDGVAAELDRALLRTRVEVAPGAAEALRALADASVPLALVSNVLHESGDAARVVLDRLGLLPRFRAVFLSCEHPWAKPSPRPFRQVCRFLGVPPARVAHLGDLEYDLRGARTAGLEAWWYVGLRDLNGYLRGQVDPASVPPERIVRSWTDVARRFR
ncbi:MAG TPA: HAD family hydrolase [Thermoplasmata archaeon]|nr:HAD family hydrolase [Thermoplasmata archaeon]